MQKFLKMPCRLILIALIVCLFQNTISAQEAKFRQSSGDDGLVCMEAENYAGMRESAVDTYWEFVEDPVDFSGTGALQALPAGQEQHKDITDAQSNADYISDAEDTLGPPETLVDTAVESEVTLHNFELAQNYPNPFNPATTIDYAIPQKASVRIEIYNTLGHKIKTLLSETKEPGYYSISWNATDDQMQPVPAGIYYYSIKADNLYQVRKMLYIK
ncbi:T9SS C-terminal target domain-containing protein [candidate division KSB1 bacterium]|nr:T9SS type A sorting domain-containing protein [candidate division KSB1 bacterium]RQW05536.1 MAG: T9SS C-terminal target domain-containing protein [candidate division KSB1 bacterium]